MYSVEVYAAVRQFVFVEGRGRREAARVFGLNRETVAKICRFSVPSEYRRGAATQLPSGSGRDARGRRQPYSARQVFSEPDSNFKSDRLSPSPAFA